MSWSFSQYVYASNVCVRDVCRYDKEEEVRSNKKGRGRETGASRKGVKRGFWMKQIGIFFSRGSDGGRVGVCFCFYFPLFAATGGCLWQWCRVVD